MLNEGNVIVYTIDTVGVEDGTVRWYSLRGANNTVITQNDFLEPIAGNVTFTANTAQLTFTANADASTLERFEYFILKLSEAENEPPIISSDDEITLVDTSNVFAFDRFTPIRNSIYETEKIVFNVYTDGGPGNAAATYYYTVSGNAELYSSNSGTVIINDNLGNIEIIPETTIPFGENRILEVQLREDSIDGDIIAESNIIVYPYISSLTNVDAVISTVTSITPNILQIISDSFVEFTISTYNTQQGEQLYYRTVGDITSWLSTPNVGILTFNSESVTLDLRPNSIGSFYLEVRRNDANTGPLLDVSPTVLKVEPQYSSYSVTSNNLYAGEQLYLNVNTINGNVLNAGSFTYNVIGNASIIGETTGTLDINFDFATLPIQLEAEDIPDGETRTLAVEITGNSTLYGPLFVTTEDIIVNRLDDTAANVTVSYVKSITATDNVIIRDDIVQSSREATFSIEFGKTVNGEQLYWTISSEADGNAYTNFGIEQKLLVFANADIQDVLLPYTLEDYSFDFEVRRTNTSPVIGRFSNVVYRGPKYIEATGGNAEVLGNYSVHTFNTAANLTVTTLGESSTLNLLEYMVIAGGGGTDNRTGFSEGSGGGGAGGMLAGNVEITSTGNLIMTVGGAGAPSTFAFGQPFAVPTTAGGGGSYCGGGGGGSGGGRSTGCNSSGGGGPGIAGQGFAGGPASGSPGPNAAGSAGGGAGAIGGGLVSRNQGGTGGLGRAAPDILGGGTWASGGGGGSPTASGYQSLSNPGGGGRGNSPTVNGEDGLPNTGGGGGGGYRQQGRLGGTGGSGIIKVGYKKKPAFEVSVVSSNNTVFAGSLAYFDITATNGWDGKKLYYSTSGNLTSFAEFSNVESMQYVFSSNTGYARLNSENTAQVAINIGSVESSKGLILHLREGSVTGNILATSNEVDIQPAFEVYSSTTLYSSNIIESEPIILQVETVGPKGQKTFYYDISGNADIVGNTTGSFLTPSNIYVIAEASVPEGETRFANVVIREDAVDGNIVYVSNAITINDYSTSASANSVVSVVTAVTSNIATVSKYTKVRITANIANYSSPETLYYTLSGDSTDYYYGSNTGSFVTSGTSATFDILTSGNVDASLPKNISLNIRRGSTTGPILSNLTPTLNVVYTTNVIVASGGSLSGTFTQGSITYQKYTFESTSNLEIQSLSFNPAFNNIRYVVVAGGGGGLGRPITHSESGGGGGGGGVLYGTVPISYDELPQSGNLSLTMKIGGGGTGAGGNSGQPGVPSVVFLGKSYAVTATGGGGSSVGLASPGGSGGGTSSGFNRGSPNPGGTGITGQGFPGGTWSGTPSQPGALGGSGGGGAGGAGNPTPSRNSGGPGGPGLLIPQSYGGGRFAGGGGGGSSVGPRTGGDGGGGNGATPTINSTSGTVNSGGGAGGATPARTTGASGGSGRIVIIYPIDPPPILP